MKLLDTFSGIGGFSLAARWTGRIRTEAFIEIDPFCQAVLKKNFHGVPIHDDIRTFDAEPFRGRIDILTGGFPCQPFSVAGKRKGKSDHRYLWPEMLRVIRAVMPRWVLAENVPGIRTKGADTVLEDLEAAGYTARAFVVGADDVGAPHRRKRVWIVAVSNSSRSAGGTGAERPGWQAWSDAYRSGAESGVANAELQSDRSEVLCNEARQPNTERPSSRIGRSGMEIATSERRGFSGSGEGGRSDCSGAFSRLDGASCLADSARYGQQRQSAQERAEGRGNLGNADRIDSDNAGHGAGEVCGERSQSPGSGRGEQCGTEPIRKEQPATECGSPALGNACCERRQQERRSAPGYESANGRQQNGDHKPCCPEQATIGQRFPESGVGVAVDGLPGWLAQWPAGRGQEQHGWEAPRIASKVAQRQAKLKSLGNAIVPQVAYWFLMAILELDDRMTEARQDG